MFLCTRESKNESKPLKEMEKGNSSLESKPLLNSTYNADSLILTDQNLLSALNSDSAQGKELQQLFMLK